MIPPFGVALPVKLVLPAETVINILQKCVIFNRIAHSLLDLGLTTRDALPDIFDQSEE